MMTIGRSIGSNSLDSDPSKKKAGEYIHGDVNNLRRIWSNQSTALLSSTSFCQIFQDFSSHRIFERMHEALNINKK